MGNALKFLKQALLILLIVVIATFIDWLVHSSTPRFFVEFEYYQNKIIFATLIGLAVFYFFWKKIQNPIWLAFLFSAIISVSLQTKYFLLGYDRFFVFLFMGLHFIMFLIPALIVFKKFRRALN